MIIVNNNYLRKKFTLTTEELSEDHEEVPTRSDISLAVVMASMVGNFGFPCSVPNLAVKVCHVQNKYIFITL